MARKGAVKAASKIKKTRKKRAEKKTLAKKVVKEQPPIQTEQIQEVQKQTSTIQQVAAEVSAEIPKTEAVAEVTDISNEAAATSATIPQQSEEITKERTNDGTTETNITQPVQETKMEENTMGSEDKESNKGIGKEYKSSDFSQPPSEAIGSSKIFLYVGISIAVVALIIGGLFFIKGFGKIGGEGLTGSTVVAYCSDTDGGYNRFTKGVAEGTYYLDYNVGEYMDKCTISEENKLTEYYCKNDLVVYATEPCPDGMSCQDGICT